MGIQSIDMAFGWDPHRGESRILYVEDDPEFAGMAADVLEDLNDQFTVHVESRGDDAREYFEETPETIDCIVSDYELPGLDGVDLLSAVRSIDPGIPFFIMTGHGSEDVAGEALSAGATDYLQKRSGIDQFELLANRIENAIDQYCTERALEYERLRMELALDQTDTFVFEIDFQTGAARRVGDFESVFGVDNEAASTWQEFINNAVHPEDRPAVRNTFEQFAAGETDRASIEYRTTPEGGDVRWMAGELFTDGQSMLANESVQTHNQEKRLVDVWDRLLGQRNTASDAPQVIGIARDITERKQREQKLRAAKERYEQLVAQNLVGLYIARQGTLIYHNSTFADIFGYQEEENALTGTAFSELVETDDRTRLREALRQAENGDLELLRRPYIGVTQDDEQVNIELLGQGITLDGRPAVLGTIIDVADRSNEWRLRRERERIEQFTSFISHDLQSPLTVAKGRIELARTAEDVQPHLEEATSALTRMEALVDDLITLTSESRPVDDVKPLGLSGIAKSTWANVATEEAALEVEATGTIVADPDRIKSVFENLYRNAVEHGGATVTVRVGDLDDGFYIEDDGPGIPPEDQETVFDSGYTTATDGTGFGLAIVKEVVQSHGWTIEVEEGANGGARFRIQGDKQPVRATDEPNLAEEGY